VPDGIDRHGHHYGTSWRIGYRMIFSEDGAYSDMADNVPKPVDQGQWLRRDEDFSTKSGNTGAKLCRERRAGEEGGFSLSRDGTTTHSSLKPAPDQDDCVQPGL